VDGFGELAVLAAYRDFIHGPFRRHTAAIVLSITAGQLAVATLLASGPSPLRRLGVIGGIVFLLAIAPLGVGSAFPSTLLLAFALAVMDRTSVQGRAEHPAA
jgi:hypothetical protein